MLEARHLWPAREGDADCELPYLRPPAQILSLESAVLSPAQIEARKGKLTASRVAALMTGDAEKILRLYREMIGEAVEEDLSDVWAVQLGAATESLNLDWYEMRRNPLSRRGEVVVHPRHDWA